MTQLQQFTATLVEAARVQRQLAEAADAPVKSNPEPSELQRAMSNHFRLPAPIVD
jgi:hypothetical protein